MKYIPFLLVIFGCSNQSPINCVQKDNSDHMQSAPREDIRDAYIEQNVIAAEERWLLAVDYLPHYKTRIISEQSQESKNADQLHQNKIGAWYDANNSEIVLVQNRIFNYSEDTIAVIMHEIGHVYGLDHSTDPSSLMHPNAPISCVSDFDCRNWEMRNKQECNSTCEK